MGSDTLIELRGKIEIGTAKSGSRYDGEILLDDGGTIDFYSNDLIPDRLDGKAITVRGTLVKYIQEPRDGPFQGVPPGTPVVFVRICAADVHVSPR